MSILCGTDFSEAAQRAVRVAVLLARRENKPLHIVHAIQLSDTQLSAEPASELVSWAKRQLARKAEAAREQGVTVTTELAAGAPDEVLLEQAKQSRAELIVIGALGHRAEGRWKLGSHADRLAQRAHVPVLVVREGDSLEEWLAGRRPLRVVLGADRTRSTEVALSAIERLRTLSPCDVTAVHLYLPSEEFERLGLGGVRSQLEPNPEVTKTLVRELTQRLGQAEGTAAVSIHTEPHVGRFGDRLALIARERGANLLVVGSHDRSRLSRFWDISVARWALHSCETSVLVVPPPPSAAGDSHPVPRLRNVLAATDFSPVGNAAVAMAFAIAEPGATVHLAHVLPDERPHPMLPHDVLALEQSAAQEPRCLEARDALRALIPSDARQVVRVYALESNEPGAAIRQAAVRLDADAICVGHRGRSQLASALLGSVAQDVVARAERPVLLVRKPLE